MVVKTDRYVYIFEFKLDKTASEALCQINGRKYDAPFGTDSRQIFKISINFSPEQRNISDWKMETTPNLE